MQNLYRKRVLSLSTVFMLAVTVSGCGGGSSSADDVDTGGGGATDTVAPVITLNGNSTVTITQGDSYSEAGATASDDVDGDLSSSIIIAGDTVTTTLAGSYTLTYNVSDSAGNNALEVTRVIIIEAASPAVSTFNMPALNDTGLTQGAGYPDGNNVDCSGEAISAQDCSSGRDRLSMDGALAKVGSGMAGFDFTKIGTDGQSLSVQDQAWDDLGNENAGTQWSCVKDNHTGLIWEVKINAVQGADLHSKADSFTWNNTNSSMNGGFSGYQTSGVPDTCYGYDANESSTFCNTQEFVTRVNEVGLCGASDWVVPNVQELLSIVNLQMLAEGNTLTAPIDTNLFPNTSGTSGTLGQDAYWTSTTAVAASGPASYIVTFSEYNTGRFILSAYSKASPYAVRLVRRP